MTEQSVHSGSTDRLFTLMGIVGPPMRWPSGMGLCGSLAITVSAMITGKWPRRYCIPMHPLPTNRRNACIKRGFNPC